MFLKKKSAQHIVLKTYLFLIFFIAITFKATSSSASGSRLPPPAYKLAAKNTARIENQISRTEALVDQFNKQSKSFGSRLNPFYNFSLFRGDDRRSPPSVKPPTPGSTNHLRPESPSATTSNVGACISRPGHTLQAPRGLNTILDFIGPQTQPKPEPQLAQGAVKVRTREELLKVLNENQSLSEEEISELRWQLAAVDDVIKNGTRTGKPPQRTPQEERLVSELGQIALRVHELRNIFPRDTQLIAVLQFLKGKNTLLQAGTGQGKSLIVGMTAILQNKLGLPPSGGGKKMAVHILAPTENLARAGLEENKKLFEACGVRARTVNDSSAGARSSDIIYGTPFDFEARALLEATYSDIPKMLLDKTVRRTVLMDESDSHLIDGASGRVLQSDPDPHAKDMSILMEEIAKRVKSQYERQQKSPALALNQSEIEREMTQWIMSKMPHLKNRWDEEKKTWIRNAVEVFDPSPENIWRDGIKFVMRKPLIDDLSSFYVNLRSSTIPPTVLQSLNINLAPAVTLLEQAKRSQSSTASEELATQLTPHLDAVITQLEPYKSSFSPQMLSEFNRIKELKNDIQRKGKFNEDIQTMIFKGQVQYLSEDTGQIISNMKFSHGIQEFLELKHLDQVVTKPTLSVRSFSMNRYVRESDIVLGLSGTVGVDDETLRFQKKVWKMDRRPVLLPEFAVPQLKKSEEKKQLLDQQAWVNSVMESTHQYSTKQPVLIIAENPEKAKLLSDQLSRERGLRTSVYMEMTDEHLLSQELAPGDVVITTNLGGRGSDYKYDKKKAPKGLHVIIGFDSDEERILQQARGRAGRAGNPGSWQQIYFGNQLKQKPKVDRVKESVVETIGEDMMFETYRSITQLIPEKSTAKAEMNQLVMNWMSNSSVRKKIQDQMTAKYLDNHLPEVSTVLSQLLMKQWRDFIKSQPPTNRAGQEFLRILDSSIKPAPGKPTSNQNISTLLSSHLSRSLLPHLKELNRLGR